jgi:pimeloyl-ACP methyl ester carboxylesterase
MPTREGTKEACMTRVTPLRAGLAAMSAFAALILAGTCGAAPAAEQTAQIDGHLVAYRVLGQGRPVLVVIGGLGEGMSAFNNVSNELAAAATVIVYDRAGYGDSGAPVGPQDAGAVERELEGLLQASGATGPYVLLGHSTGGLYAEYFAAKHPDLIAGLVLEESRPADFTARCQMAGLAMCVATPAMVRFMGQGAQADVAAFDAVMDQVAATPPLTSKPVLVLSRPAAAGAKPIDMLWAQAQADLAARYPGSHHLTAPAGGHDMHHDERDWFLATVRDFLASVP